MEARWIWKNIIVCLEQQIEKKLMKTDFGCIYVTEIIKRLLRDLAGAIYYENDSSSQVH